MRLIAWLPAAVTVGLAMAAQKAPEPKLISVCELLREPSRYNGQTIALRGEYSVGADGLYLRGVNCDGALKTKSHAWPSEIWLADAQSEYEKRGLDAKQFVNCVIQIGRARAQARERARSGGGTEKITLTYTGRFETYNNFEDPALAGPSGVPIGFGPVPGAPGQLLVQSVEDIVVEYEPLK